MAISDKTSSGDVYTYTYNGEGQLNEMRDNNRTATFFKKFLQNSHFPIDKSSNTYYTLSSKCFHLLHCAMQLIGGIVGCMVSLSLFSKGAYPEDAHAHF